MAGKYVHRTIDELADEALQANMRRRMEIAVENVAELALINVGINEAIRLLEAQVMFLKEFE